MQNLYVLQPQLDSIERQFTDQCPGCILPETRPAASPLAQISTKYFRPHFTFPFQANRTTSNYLIEHFDFV
jgi:hypothetical protein